MLRAQGTKTAKQRTMSLKAWQGERCEHGTPKVLMLLSEISPTLPRKRQRSRRVGRTDLEWDWSCGWDKFSHSIVPGPEQQSVNRSSSIIRSYRFRREDHNLCWTEVCKPKGTNCYCYRTQRNRSKTSLFSSSPRAVITCWHWVTPPFTCVL